MDRKDVISARMARKRVSITFKATEEERDLIAKYCIDNGITQSDFIRKVVFKEMDSIKGIDEKEYIQHEITISKNLLDAITDLLYERDKNENINDFIIDAIVQKFNEINNLFGGKVNSDGFIED